jgi:hypothetical protein
MSTSTLQPLKLPQDLYNQANDLKGSIETHLKTVEGRYQFLCERGPRGIRTR